MFDLTNNATCKRLRKLLDDEVRIYTGSSIIVVHEVRAFQDRGKNTYTLQVVALCESSRVSSFIKKYIKQLFGLNCTYIDESHQSGLRYKYKNKILVYDKVNKNNLSAIDVLCRMKGY